ncbi:glycoside hydrolase family 2 TIM barrel-domain containing protein [Pseudofrankia inefficax]|uniref:Beta-galactosidase n=1 Tax=Pseudofrankia inefficax (strain DSM 45817 / CECT 9037 / DDB 130130 / EuI1c) TaxID=298654 RepID=E3IUF5_PSEI1|nr:glycoside hydrolase family 2 TIM barrel-domain containing protein [Pseudofrankia inefficax]ADP83640.1 glycoside hydrolase family 2 TIM barrel [Pseudofrankia inefficax]
MTATSFTAMPWDGSGFHAVRRLPMHGLRRPADVELDGAWEFQLLPSPTAPVGDVWKTVDVPGLWTMSETDDRPHYTNVAMPFDEVPPQIPARNPTGVYRRSFALRPDPGRQVILRIGAAEGLLRAFVNGHAVGISTDSHLAAEFDITDACVAGPDGEHTVELVVSKWSSVSYLEDQDQWWHAGLSRSVSVHTVPRTRLADLKVHADYDPAAQRGGLRLRVSTAGLDGLRDEGWTVEVEALGERSTAPVAPLRDAPRLPALTGDRSVRPPRLIPPDLMDLPSLLAADAPIPADWAPAAAMMGPSLRPLPVAGTAVLDRADLDVRPWSAESPHLYDVIVRLADPDGRIVDETTTRVGFRRVTIEGRDLLVNGRRVLVQGVDRHDVDPATGRVMRPERLLAELSLLKRFNVNAIRTSHYPNDPLFLDLCDEIGFYVVDEADIEAHAFSSALCDDPRYLPAFLDRVSRMVLRDRNHPCVIIWSLGNETGYGANHDAAAAWVRRFDPTRPVQYEGAIASDWHGGHPSTDLVCPMYPSFESLAAYSADPRADRPLILCEYAYSQGNSNGGLAEYWAMFETLPGLQGGFIWEFTDHALDPDGDGRYRYGGDFGDVPNDGIALLNGIAFPDLTPKPALYEARGLFSPVRIVSDAAAALAGTISVRNRQVFNDLGAFTFELQVEDGGESGPVTVDMPDVPAGTTGTLRIPEVVRARLEASSPLAVTLTVRTRADTRWAPAATVIAAHQVVFERPAEPVAAPVPARLPVGEDGELAHPLLRTGPRLCLWRALTDNDRSFALDQRFVRSGFFQLTPRQVEIRPDGEGAAVTTRYATAFDTEVVHHRTIAALTPPDHPYTEYLLRERVVLPDDTEDALRVGVVFELCDGFDEARWVGLGPWENYPDRRSSALLGAWHSRIDDLAVPYLFPQENGGRGQTTELRLTGPAGTVSTFHQSPLHMTVRRHRVEELEAASHWWELPPSAATVVHLDVAHRGLGTAVLGPDTRPRFRLPDREYAWTWRLRLDERPPR